MRGHAGGGSDRLHRRHAAFDHDAELAGVQAVREHTRVAREDDRYAELHGTREGLALQLGGVEVLLQEFGGPTLAATLGVDVITVVDIHGERDATLAREQQTLLVDDGGMLDGVGPCEDGFFDRARAVRVRREPLTAGFGFAGDRFDLGGGHLGRTRDAAG